MPKTILLTGATGGLGKATALELAKSDMTLVLLARDKSKLDTVVNEIRVTAPNAKVEMLLCDFANLQSIRAAADEYKRHHTELHVLINNAGIYKKDRVVVGNNLEAMFAVNYLGPWLLTNLLLDTLKASTPSTIITISAPSTTKLNFDDLQGEKKYSTLNAFGASKMADTLFTFAIARKLEGSGVTANVYSPGLMKSELMRDAASPIKLMMKLFAKDPAKAAPGLAALATDPQLMSKNGIYVDRGKIKKAPAYAYNTEAQDKLWRVSEELVK